MAKHALYLLSILQAIVTAHAVCDGNSNGMCNGETCYNIEIGLIFDDYPGETKWEISQGRRNSIENENAVVLKESPYYDPEKNYAEASETHILCLPQGKYTFTIMDRNEDGMCCDNGEGRYAVTYQETGEIITHGSKYEKVSKKHEYKAVSDAIWYLATTVISPQFSLKRSPSKSPLRPLNW